MKQFSLLVRVPDTYSPEQVRRIGPSWDNLIEAWKKEGIYFLSFAFPGESFTVSGEAKSIKKESVLSNGLRVVSNIVLRLDTMAEAVEKAKYCPILKYGGSIEIREVPKPLYTLER